jgi:inner membrane protein
VDSVTQLVLGATVAEAVAGRRLGRRAALLGAVCGTLPDLDALIPLADPVARFTYHRSWSHSIFVLTAIAPLVAWLAMKASSVCRAWPRQTLLAAWLALVTHPVLDCFTVYGTQILLPFSDHPVSGSTIFIIDPLYTIPLAIALLLALREPDWRLARRSAVLGLAVTSAYLATSVGVKQIADRRAADAIAAAGLDATAVLSTPAPLNILLWRFVAMRGDGYCEGFFSVLDPPGTPEFSCHESQTALAPRLAGDWAFDRLAWFTHGFYRLREAPDGRVVMTDLRMGVEGFYIFSFALPGTARDGVAVEQIPPPPFSLDAFGRLMRRIVAAPNAAERGAAGGGPRPGRAPATDFAVQYADSIPGRDSQ